MLAPTPLFGGNAAFLDTLYEQYLRDPASVEEHWRTYFEQLPGEKRNERAQGPLEAQLAARAREPRTPSAAPGPAEGDERQAAVSRLI